MSLPDWSELSFWLQLAAAVVTVLFAPWAVELAKFAFRRRYIFRYSPMQEGASGNWAVWNLEIENRTREVSGHSLYVYSSNSHQGSGTNFINMGNDTSDMLSYKIDVKPGRTHIVVDFWPKQWKLRLRVHLPATESPRFDSDKYAVVTRFVRPPEKILSNVAMLDLARLRVLALISQFTIVALICLIRIAYIGLTQ